MPRVPFAKATHLNGVFFMQNDWAITNVTLKFSFGEINFFKKIFPLMVLNSHFTKLPNDPDKTYHTLKELPDGVQGALIRSHPTRISLPSLKFMGRIIRYVPNQYEHYYVDLTGSFADYLKGFSSKSRATLGRKIRKFETFSEGKTLWREFREPWDMKEFHMLAREVSKKTYQEKLLDMGLPSRQEFIVRITELASEGLARGYILFHGENPIAYLYCPIKNGILFYEYLGYEPEFRSWSPGTVLQYLVLEKLFNEGDFRIFDFTEGDGSHKRAFSTGSVRCADVYYFRATIKNLSILSIHRGLAALSRNTTKIFDLLRIKDLAKKFIRSHA